MPRFRYRWRYRSSLGVGEEGDETDMPADLAERINRDSPGVLAEVKGAFVEAADEPEARATDKPPHDRQVKVPGQKRGAP